MPDPCYGRSVVAIDDTKRDQYIAVSYFFSDITNTKQKLNVVGCFKLDFVFFVCITFFVPVSSFAVEFAHRPSISTVSGMRGIRLPAGRLAADGRGWTKKVFTVMREDTCVPTTFRYYHY